MFLDGRYGREALFAASHAKLWTARPIERTGSRPLDFENGGSLGAQLVEWPSDQVVKCLCFYHPDDDETLRLRQERELLRAQDACRRLGRDLLVEIIAGKHGSLEADTLPRVLGRLYDIGIRPDWWKLEPQRDPANWVAIGEVIEARDPMCRGIVLLGLFVLMLVHSAHRFRYTLYDGLQIKRKRTVAVLCYGAAVVGSVAAVAVLGSAL